MNGRSRSFREVEVWRKAHALTLAVYGVTRRFPVEERYGLVSQLRRCASSVPSNFVEGFRRRTTPDKVRFYNTAQGSADECLYQLILAHDLEYADTRDLQDQAEEVGRMLSGYMDGLERNPA